MTTTPAAPPVPAPPDGAKTGPPGRPGTPLRPDNRESAKRKATRWQAIRPWLLTVLVLAVLVTLAALSRPATSGTPFAPDNPEGTGTQALAKVLEKHGVHVNYVRSMDEALQAGAGQTLVVIDNGLLSSGEEQALAQSPADLVLVEPGSGLVEAATDGKVEFDADWGSGQRYAADCSDPDALAAKTTWMTSDGFSATEDATSDTAICFSAPLIGTESKVGGYAVTTAHGHTVRLLADAGVLTNSSITRMGNAALALRALGHHPQLTWYIPSENDPYQRDSANTEPSVLPDYFGVVILQFLLLVLVIAIWRGRRFGALVPERLPVTVKASEAVRGRARLYRAARSRGHAAAGLRAAAARRMATKLGLSPQTTPAALVSAIATATRRTENEIGNVLYGPPPPDDTALDTLARTLDQIESEVYHS